jgi:GNAT superfamily N-acetyltransferase
MRDGGDRLRAVTVLGTRSRRRPTLPQVRGLACRDGAHRGCAALKAESLPTHRHLTPWAAAGFVLPAERGRGIGARLLLALEHEARQLGYRRIHCGTATAESPPRRCGWRLAERIDHDGIDLGIYDKAL